MNGFSLLVAVAALGVDVGWEKGPDGQPTYTIRIEQLLLQPLREGQAILSAVDANDRGLRRFQIVVDGTARRSSTSPRIGDTATRSEMVQHGWKAGPEGGIDYMVQISPERFETLATGTPVVGVIDPLVTDIRRIYIFVGVQQLPREGGQRSSGSAAQPPQYLRQDNGFQPASAEVDASSGSAPRVTAPRTSSQFNSERGTTTTVSDGNGYPRGNYLDDRNDWQHSGTLPADGGTSGGTFAGGGAAGPNARGATLPVPQLPERNTNYGYAPPSGQSPVNHGGYAAQPPPQQPAPTYAASPPPQQRNLNDTEFLAAITQAVVAAQKSSPPQLAIQQPAPAPAAPAAVAAARAEEPKPWLPLLLTALALLASLGTNMYLGWLAWTFFWRYRDAAGDVARARSSVLAGRQAA